MSEGALVKCNSGPISLKDESGFEAKRVAPKRQSDPSIRSVACEPEERLLSTRKTETSSVPSLVTALSVPTSQPAKSHVAVALNTRSASSPAPGCSHFIRSSLEHMPSVQYPPILVTNSPISSANYSEHFTKYDSVGDHGYYSMLNDFQKLSLSSGTDSFYKTESEYVIHQRNHSTRPEPCLSHSNSNSFSSFGELYLSSADSNLEENAKRHQTSSQNRLRAFSHGFHHEALTRVQSDGQEEPKQMSHKQPGSHLAQHVQHPSIGARSSCPGIYPLPYMTHPSPISQPGRSLGMTRMDSISDSHLYESNPMRQRRPPLCREQHASWDPLPFGAESFRYHSFPLSSSPMRAGCERFMVRSVPEKMEQIWMRPWEDQSTDYVAGQVVPDHQYETYRNLCNIFPSYIVRSVMEKNPQMTDPQQLAAVIVASNSCR